MSEYARVVVFEADDESIDALVKEINAAEGPPPGIKSTRITVLADRSKGRAIVAARFGSEADLKAAHEAFEAMSPPEAGSIRRVSVDMYEVLVERDA
jgi:hypothetical protein